MDSLRKPKNPCVGVCKIDRDTGWCRGCWRTKAEIKQWKQLSREARRRLLDALAKRRRLSKLSKLALTPERMTPTLSKPQPESMPAPPIPRALAAESDWLGRAVRHRNSGRLYWELCRGVLRADGTVMVVYRDEDGRIWIRPAEQFDNRRYKQAGESSTSTVRRVDSGQEEQQ